MNMKSFSLIAMLCMFINSSLWAQEPTYKEGVNIL